MNGGTLKFILNAKNIRQRAAETKMIIVEGV